MRQSRYLSLTGAVTAVGSKRGNATARTHAGVFVLCAGCRYPKGVMLPTHTTLSRYKLVELVVYVYRQVETRLPVRT